MGVLLVTDPDEISHVSLQLSSLQDRHLSKVVTQNLSQGHPPYRVDCIVSVPIHRQDKSYELRDQSDEDFSFQYTISPPDPPSNLDDPMESISSMKMIEGACSLLKRKHYKVKEKQEMWKTKLAKA